MEDATKLEAAYHSPQTTQTFSQDLPSPKNDGEHLDVKEKTAFLSALRTSITQIQADVNVFLTQKMEEEKASQASNGAKTKEEKEVENYGGEELEDSS